MLSPSQALEIVAGMTNKQAHNLNTLLADTVGTTFANMISVTDVSVAAPHKKAGVVIKKVVQSTIIVANNLKEGTNLYKNKVMRTIEGDAETFVFSGSNYERVGNDAYSVISLRSNNDKKYLEAMPQSIQGVHYTRIQGGKASIITKDALAAMMTPSAAKKLLEDSSTVKNKENDVEHKAIYRAYKTESIHSLKIGGEVYVGEFTA